MIDTPSPTPPETELPAPGPAGLTLGVLTRFLIGERGAILRAWSSPSSLAVGAVLVVSASLARHYDHHDLIREWHVLLHGLGASIANALLLYSLARFAARRSLGWRGFWPGYWRFLGVFWLTAPMAWLYGIPYEQMMSPIDAVRANLWTLALVSLWRVALMARVIQVVWSISYGRALVLTLLFGNVVAVAALTIAPLPTFHLMGGLDTRPGEVRLVAEVAWTAGCLAILVLPILLTAGLMIVCTMKTGATSLPRVQRGRLTRGPLVLAIGSILAWLAAAAFTQGPLRLRDEVRRAVASKDYVGVVELLNRHDRGDFPPVWEVPPARHAWGFGREHVEMARVLARGNAAAWIRRDFARGAGWQIGWELSNFSSPGIEYAQGRIEDTYGSFEGFVLLARLVLEHDLVLAPDERTKLLRDLEAVEARLPPFTPAAPGR